LAWFIGTSDAPKLTNPVAMSVWPAPEPTERYAEIVAFEFRASYAACAAFIRGASKVDPPPAIVAGPLIVVSEAKLGSAGAELANAGKIVVANRAMVATTAPSDPRTILLSIYSPPQKIKLLIGCCPTTVFDCRNLLPKSDRVRRKTRQRK
jgi:hypothetical protein